MSIGIIFYYVGNQLDVKNVIDINHNTLVNP